LYYFWLGAEAGPKKKLLRSREIDLLERAMRRIKGRKEKTSPLASRGRQEENGKGGACQKDRMIEKGKRSKIYAETRKGGSVEDECSMTSAGEARRGEVKGRGRVGTQAEQKSSIYDKSGNQAKRK